MRYGWLVLTTFLVVVPLPIFKVAAAEPGSAPSLVLPQSREQLLRALNAIIEAPGQTPEKLAAAYGVRAALSAQAMNFDMAIADLTSAIKLQEKADFYFARAGLYALTKQYDEALADFGTVIQLEPNAPRGHGGRAQVFREIGDDAGYAAETDAVIAMAPNPTVPLRERAEVYFNHGAFEKAIADYTAVLSRQPDDVDMLASRGDAETSIGRYLPAIADYEVALRLDPDGKKAPYARINIIQPIYALGRYDEALAKAVAVADAAPDNAYRLLALEAVRFRAGRLDVKDFAARARHIDLTKWPGPMIALTLGSISESDARSAAVKAEREKDESQTCEFSFYRGQQQLMGGDRAAAMDLFRRAAADCPPGFTEYSWARIELEKAAATP